MKQGNFNGMTRRQAGMAVAAAVLAPKLSFAAGTDIDAALQRAVESKSIPGVVATAANRKGVIYHGAYGLADIGTGRAMKEDALFRIASMTKAITSTAAMQLMEQGKFALEDPVEKYLPEFAKLQMFASVDPKTGDYKLKPVKNTVTVRHLFTHTSGLEYYFLNAAVRDFKPRPGENYPVGPLVFEPGTQWCYGTSTDQLGHLVERISGRSLEDYFRQNIFTPLSMHDTFYDIPGDKAARLVPTNHRTADGTIVKDAEQAGAVFPVPVGGSGLASTAPDYLRFTRMILNGGTLDGARVLSAASVAEMGKNHIGAMSVPVMRTIMPDRTNDFTFINGGHDKWGLGFLLNAAATPGKRAVNSLAWGGINNTYYWIDPTRGVTGVIKMQFLPFADPTALTLYDAFERGVYRIA